MEVVTDVPLSLFTEHFHKGRMFSCFVASSYRYLERRTKVRFRRRTLHEPNLIRINTDPNYLDRLNLIQTPILIPAELNSEGENAHFGQTAYKIRYKSLCIKFGTWKVRRLNQRRSKVDPKEKFLAGLGGKTG